MGQAAPPGGMTGSGLREFKSATECPPESTGTLRWGMKAK